MGDARFKSEELDLLVARHIELCELFDEKRPMPRRSPPNLVTMSEGKATVECLADLVDRALLAYEGKDFSQDPTIYALKIALTDTIMSLT
jgi:hypothetical protein